MQFLRKQGREVELPASEYGVYVYTRQRDDAMSYNSIVCQYLVRKSVEVAPRAEGADI